MAILEPILFVVFVIPISCFMATIFVLAALGKSLGFRKKYVEFLLWIFEYGHKRIEDAQHSKRGEEEDNDDSGQESGEEDANSNLNKSLVIQNKTVEDVKKSSFSHLSHENDTATVIRNRTNSFRTRYPSGSDEPADYEFSDAFEFIQSGIEAIVNDQVTQRFVAEELKSWNLLTRTNRHYEFISWRLSLVWVAGFFLRYCIMLPLRITICFIGTSTLLVLTFVIGLIPESWPMKQQLNDHATKFLFRLLSRAFSAIITYHQVENKPKNNGICVANHTSPIDVVVLACDSSYAMVLCLTLSTFLIGLIPFGYTKFRRDVYHFVCHHTFGLLSWAISAVIRHHDVENRPGSWKLTNDGKLVKAKEGEGFGGICVANHTSPIDVLVLAVDNTYDLIGQSHGGFLGVLQRALARASSHIWFERSEIKDRSAVARRLKAHVEDTTKLPILIFPEGTCINNSAVMQFKKGSFEVGGIIYPVAIKYDPRFGDPFWNSSEFSMLQYLYMMMTSWAIVCDVWYLPPMTRNPGECSVDFANRVKKEIAEKGGLVDLDWDGQLKRAPAKREWKEKQQLEYSKKFAISSRHIVSKTDATSDSPNPST